MTKDASYPRHGRPSPRLTEVTLIDRGGLLVQAHWSENGALVITGQDRPSLGGAHPEASGSPRVRFSLRLSCAERVRVRRRKGGRAIRVRKGTQSRLAGPRSSPLIPVPMLST